MTPEDERHGTYAGAVQHWFDKEPLCDPCKTAETRYRKRRKLRALRGDQPTIPALGTIRRFQALQALGWSGPFIAKEADVSIDTLRALMYHNSSRVTTTTAAKMQAVYARLSMVRPEGGYANRNRGLAKRKGCAPPLAWDDIDNDEAPHVAPEITPSRDEIDEAVVLRILAGDRMEATRAEREEVVRRWIARGHDVNELARRTGWKIERYGRKGAA